MLLLLALTAEACPGHGVQPSSGDGVPARFTDSIYALLDPTQRLFARPRQTQIALMQPDLKLCFNIGTGLVHKIALPAPCSRYRGGRFEGRSRQFLPLGMEQSFVSL